MLVQCYYDVQRARISFDQRLAAAAPKDPEARIRMETDEEGITYLGTMQGNLDKELDETLKMIKTELKKYPIWIDWLQNVKGVGELMGAVLISSLDIEKPNVSKWWQYCGLNPGEVFGWVSDGKDAEGRPKWKISETKIRGDKKTPGFRCPYNAWLKTKLLGVLGSSFIKSQSSYALRFYYPLHMGKEKQKQGLTGRLDNEEGWKTESDKHRHFAAIRYMMKMFLLEFWMAWREIEGLPVTPSYQEAKLGHKHSA